MKVKIKWDDIHKALIHNKGDAGPRVIEVEAEPCKELWEQIVDEWFSPRPWGKWDKHDWGQCIIEYNGKPLVDLVKSMIRQAIKGELK